MTRLQNRIVAAILLVPNAIFVLGINAAACVLPEPPQSNVWAVCEEAATACPLDDGSFGQCHITAGRSVCAPFGECPADLGDGGENGKPFDDLGACLWQCATDIDCPDTMVCDGVCMYEADDDLP